MTGRSTSTDPAGALGAGVAGLWEVLAIQVALAVEHTVLTDAAAATGIRRRVVAARGGTHPGVARHLRVVAATLCARVVRRLEHLTLQVHLALVFTL